MNTPRVLALLALAAAIGGAPWLESRMMLHMFVQLPLLLASGVLFAIGSISSNTAHVPWPLARVGCTIVFVTGVITTWMIPRALDAAVEHWMIDVLKGGTMLLAGAFGYSAWQQASTVVRTFVFGNAAWMTAVAGMLFLDARERLCTTYGAGEQKQAGVALISVTVIAVLLVLRAVRNTDFNTVASRAE